MQSTYARTDNKSEDAGFEGITRVSFRKISRKARWFPAVLLLLLAPLAHAQFGSSISGTVLDPSKAAIPNASVTITNTATQQTQVTTSNTTGYYHFSELAPGSYSIVVTAVGFKTNNVTDVAISAQCRCDPGGWWGCGNG
jgi:hypothetical protein